MKQFRRAAACPAVVQELIWSLAMRPVAPALLDWGLAEVMEHLRWLGRLPAARLGEDLWLRWCWNAAVEARVRASLGAETGTSWALATFTRETGMGAGVDWVQTDL